MKTEFTFNEIAKVCAQVEKVEEVTMQFVELTNNYNEVDAAFEDEFSKYGYTFFGAPAEVHTMFDEKCSLMDERDKAGRKAYKAIKTFAELIGLGENYSEWIEDELQNYLLNRRYWQAPEMVKRVKSLARTASKNISINA